jgi:hypothetical protein
MSEPLTIEQQATNYETMRHIEQVRNLLNLFAGELLHRGEAHDQSKMRTPEVEGFTEYTKKLATCTYGSPEYEGYLKALGEALTHHYAKNRHHPEHFKEGIDGMNLIDLVEMFCDWKAATMRHHDGNLRKSITHNATRFGINPQLVKILENTADLFDK